MVTDSSNTLADDQQQTIMLAQEKQKLYNEFDVFKRQQLELLEREKHEFFLYKKQQEEQLSKERIAAKQLIEKIASASNHGNKLVKLNVGGTMFTTMLETITADRPSFFSAWFSGYFNNEPGDDGAYFVDRCPKHFAIILEYMRTKQCHVAHLSKNELHELIEEVKFYSLAGMLQALQPAVPFTLLPGHNTAITLAQNFRSAKLQRFAPNYDCNVFCAAAKRWRFRIVNNCEHLLFGVADKEFVNVQQQQAYNAAHVYAISCFNGNIFAKSLGFGNGKKWANNTCHSKGTIIDVSFEQGSLRVAVNNQDWGFAFANLPQHLQPFFLMHQEGCEFELLE